MLYPRIKVNTALRGLMKLDDPQWHSVADLVGAMDTSQGLMSRQLALLQEKGLVEVKKDGRRRFYRITT